MSFWEKLQKFAEARCFTKDDKTKTLGYLLDYFEKNCVWNNLPLHVQDILIEFEVENKGKYSNIVPDGAQLNHCYY